MQVMCTPNRDRRGECNTLSVPSTFTPLATVEQKIGQLTSDYNVSSLRPDYEPH